MATDLDDIDKILAQEASNATREEEVSFSPVLPSIPSRVTEVSLFSAIGVEGREGFQVESL
jgi:hypothetical protein